MPREPQHRTWADYRRDLPPETFEVVLATWHRVAQALADRKVDAEPVLRPKWWAFLRGRYQMVGGSAEPGKPGDFYIKLRDDPRRLSVRSPCPSLEDVWLPRANRIWKFVIPTLADVPDIGTAIELMLEFQPETGPMKAPAWRPSGG